MIEEVAVTEISYMERLENVLDMMGVKTFDSPMTLDYRFGSFQAEEGIFRCFVNEDDVTRALSYMEIKGDQVYWITLEYPGLEIMVENIVRVGVKCRKTLGRHHAATFIIAVPEGVGKDRERLEQAFQEFSDSQDVSVYYTLKIWDEETLKSVEKQVRKSLQRENIVREK